MMRTMGFIPGTTIEGALLGARKAARLNNDTVMAIINDIVMFIDKETNIKKALAEYQDKLSFKFEIAKMKKQMNNTK